MAGLDLKAAQWEQQHRAHVEEYLRQIDALYDAASEELVRYLRSEISCPR